MSGDSSLMSLLVLVYVNMVGILLIVIVGLALTRPLATGSFVVSTNALLEHVDNESPLILSCYT